MTLWQLEPQQKALVISMDALAPVVKQRLNELGLRASGEVLCVQRGPFSGPRAYKISGGVFALDQEIAEAVLVKLDVS